MANKWFETVAIAQRRAEKRLPKSVYGALIAGSEKGLSSRDNLDSFDQLGLSPHIAGLARERSLATTVMGQSVSMPVLISPTGVQAVHPQGEVAVARAAANRGVAMGLSSFASKSIEEVCAANNQVFFQMYWAGDRDTMIQRLSRAKAAGAKGIILTLDWSFANGRDWGSPWIPEKIDLKSAIKLTPEALSRPRSVPRVPTNGPYSFAHHAQHGDSRSKTTDIFRRLLRMDAESAFHVEEVAWLRAQWEGPFMVKGVGRIDDAKRVVDLGATALSVSNHGGNNLDGTPAPIRMLPAIADAVGDQIEVLLDGGVRRGSDVIKALALGARAVMIGRAYLWGLAANGQAGVENVLDVLRSGIDSTLLGLGKSSITELDRSDVVAPPDFFRKSGWMNRVAIVTGAARGIGAATVDALVNDGYRVLAVDRCRDIPDVPYAMATPADLESVVARHGDAVLALVGDVRSATDMQLAVETATRHFGRLDAVIAGAGVVAAGAPLWEITDATWDAGVVGERTGHAAADRSGRASPGLRTDVTRTVESWRLRRLRAVPGCTTWRRTPRPSTRW